MHQHYKIQYFYSILIIISLSVLTYLNALNGDFVWDDNALIVENEFIGQWDYLQKIFAKDFFDTSEEIVAFKYGYYRPLIIISYMIDYTIWGLAPWGFHLSNIIYHTGCCTLIFFIFSLLLKKTRIALIASLLFACHPIHTESVTWISGRTDVIACLFFLLSFYLFQKSTHRSFLGIRIPAQGSKIGNVLQSSSKQDDFLLSCWKECKHFFSHNKIYYICSVILFSAAMLCKEMAATLPLLTIAYTCYFSDWKWMKRYLVAFFLSIPYFFVLLLYSFIRFEIFEVNVVGNPETAQADSFYSLSISFTKTILLYFYKLMYPKHLSAYIINPTSLSVTEPIVILSIAFVGLLIFSAVWFWKRRRKLSFLVFFFLITLLPLANFIRISAPLDMGFVMAERFLYIPSIGFCGFAASLLSTPWNIRSSSHHVFKYVSIIVLVVIMSLYSVRTVLRNNDWINEKAFFVKTVEDAPHAALLHHVLGNVCAKEKNYKKALAYYIRAIQLHPKHPTAYNNIGTIYNKIGLIDSAIMAFKKAIFIHPAYVQARFNLGIMYYKKGLIDEAIREFEKVISLNPGYVRAHNNLGIIYAEQGQLHKAQKRFELALKYDPKDKNAQSNLEIITEELNDIRKEPKDTFQK